MACGDGLCADRCEDATCSDLTAGASVVPWGARSGCAVTLVLVPGQPHKKGPPLVYCAVRLVPRSPDSFFLRPVAWNAAGKGAA